MNRKSTVPTIKDVAREAGVSVGTVSKVLNGKPVGDIYEKKVQEAIAKLNYQVNSFAKSLKSGKTYAVAVILPNTVNPFFGKLASYINIALTKRGYRMYLCCTDYDEKQEQLYVEMARQNKIDGIIALTYSPNLEVCNEVPFVSIDRPFDSGVICVSSDNYAGGVMAARKLAELGCRRVLYLSIGTSLINEPAKRRAGFQNGCLSCGLELSEMLLEDSQSITEIIPFIRERVHDGKPDFEGIFCVTDSMAYSVIRILEEFGIRVPDDVQVIGYDGLRQPDETEYVCSTIEQPVDEIAKTAVDMLFAQRITLAPLICLPVKYVKGPTTRD